MGLFIQQKQLIETLGRLSSLAIASRDGLKDYAHQRPLAPMICPGDFNVGNFDDEQNRMTT